MWALISAGSNVRRTFTGERVWVNGSTVSLWLLLGAAYLITESGMALRLPASPGVGSSAAVLADDSIRERE